MHVHALFAACMQGHLGSVTPAMMDKHGADLWLLAPPCQPYTRQARRAIRMRLITRLQTRQVAQNDIIMRLLLSYCAMLFSMSCIEIMLHGYL